MPDEVEVVAEDDVMAELEDFGEAIDDGSDDDDETAGAQPAKAAKPQEAEPPDEAALATQVENLNVALRHERATTRSMQQKAQEFEAKMQQRFARVLGVMERMTAKPPPEPPMFEEDPERAVRHIVDETVGKHVGGLAAQQEAKDKEAKDRAALERRGNEVAAFVHQDRQQFLEDEDMTEDEMKEAETHYFNARMEEYKAYNPTMTEDELREVINREVAAFWVEYADAKQPIHAQVLQMAKAAGWKRNGASAPGAGTPLAAAAKRMGKVVPVGAAPPPKPPSGDKMNLAQVPEMTDKQFDKWERDMLAAGADREDLHEELLKEVGEFL
jgi:septal ring factor EnvC (AmiA/AmiB activator)